VEKRDEIRGFESAIGLRDGLSWDRAGSFLCHAQRPIDKRLRASMLTFQCLNQMVVFLRSRPLHRPFRCDDAREWKNYRTPDNSL
jgi:hypothetical protein